MEALIALLNTPAGVFFSQLSVMLILFGTVLVAAGWQQSVSGIPVARMHTGLAVLLMYRLAQAVIAVALPPTQTGLDILYFLEHNLTIASYICLVWLWAAPEPSRTADAGTWILSALTMVAALTGAGIILQTGYAFFSDPALLSTIGLALLAAGILLLIRRQPELWGFGLAMLLFLGFGEALSLAFSTDPTAAAGLLRLAQIAAYPILLTLPQRILTRERSPAPAQPAFRSVPERKRFNLPATVFSNFLTMGIEPDLLTTCRRAVEGVSYALIADICLIISRPTESDEIIIFCGFDQVLEQEIPGAQIAARHLPMVLSAMQKNTPLRLPASSASSDLKFLSSTLRLPKSGHLLVAPIRTDSQTGIGALVLLTPYSSRTWSREDQEYLAGAAENLGRLFDRAQASGRIEESLRSMERELEDLRNGDRPSAQNEPGKDNHELISALEASAFRQSELEEELATLRSKNEQMAAAYAEKNWEQTIQHLQAENIQLQLAVNELENDLKDQHARSEGLRAAKQEALNNITSLSKENDRLHQELGNQSSQSVTQAENGAMPKKDPRTEAALAEALREIARLESLASEAEIRIVELQNLAESGSAQTRQWESIIHLAEEMRQPMSSILGYSDFLLTESVGLLGALQRKFLERVKSATNRMSTMVEDLVHIAAKEAGTLKLNLGMVDLNNVIDSAIAAATIQIREKQIALLVNLPDDLPTIEGDREAIRLTVVHLLQNAVTATPQDGQITIELGVEQKDPAGQMMAIHVRDSGAGIDPEHLSAVFDRSQDIHNRKIPGLGVSTSGLSIARTLVEAHGGRIWVESQINTGTTFSIVLPISRTPAAESLGSKGD